VPNVGGVLGAASVEASAGSLERDISVQFTSPNTFISFTR
jgi:hypothetical protein